MTAQELARAAAAALDSKKGIQIRAIGIREISSLTDYFVIASGTSNTHVHALADEVEFRLKQQGLAPARIENGESWILLDYGSVIVHIFQEKAREFYDLERLWKDGTELPLDDVLNED